VPHDLVIYDCDGTLIDTETIYAEINLSAYHRIGLTHWTMDSYVDAMVGIPVAAGRKIIEADYGGPLPPDFEEAIEREVKRRFLDELQTLPGVREAVNAIDGPRCVASSTSLQPLKRNLATAGLIDLFAAETMGARPERCLVIEDSVPGVLAARSAGMPVIGFTGVAHDKERIASRLKEAGALAVIGHMNEWPAMVRAIREG
jgi:beta-phosphoglucomutase-like phosphatase (HAD superfamily)